jgi:hypothetical protein
VADFQIWLVSAFAKLTPIRTLMHTRWGWPAAESVHFIGLSLLIGTIFLFDLRLLGAAKRIPIAALHRLVPWGIFGYGLTAASGVLFLMSEPDQYIYNPAFQLKVLFMVSAGVNAAVFYLMPYRRLEPGTTATPRSAKIIAVTSLCLWIAVVIAGRLLTFYRPWPCDPSGPGVVAQCIPDYRL